MTDRRQGTAIASTGWDEAAAADWVLRGSRGDELSTPWRLTAEIVAADNPGASRVLDVASGPGGFLETVLERLPGASGVWFDFSETMRAEAERNLAALNGRVQFRIGDMVGLDAAGPAGSFDLVTTSRATHHLTVHDLGRFYSQAADCLKAGGWVANLDNLNPGEPWAARLRDVRRAMRPPRAEGDSPGSGHPHLVEPPLLEDHLACIRAAGFEPALVLWRNLNSGLVMAKKPA